MMGILSGMTIGEFLKTNGLDEEGFASRSDGTFSAEAVRKWRFGQRIPRPQHLRKITEITDGAVTANDFFALSSPTPAGATATP